MGKCYGGLRMDNKKILLVSSTGGHYAQLKNLNSVISNHSNITSYILTEKRDTERNENKYYLVQQDRNQIQSFIYNTFKNALITFKCLIDIKPDVVISTGAGATLPALIIGRLIGSKIIFIESFSKVHSLTLTGKIAYHIANKFYVQWDSDELIRKYPKAIYKGKLY